MRKVAAGWGWVMASSAVFVAVSCTDLGEGNCVVIGGCGWWLDNEGQKRGSRVS